MIIENFLPQGGHHCITNSLKQIFEFNNYPISEPMLLGLGSGLGFVYINLANSPMIAGREKIGVYETNLENRTGIKIRIKTPKNEEIAHEKLLISIENKTPILVYVDMPYLNYLNMQNNGHFGGHSIVVFGVDKEEKCFYISDRDSSNWKIHTPKGKIGADFHKVTFEELMQARNSSHRPFPANNKWVDFDFSNAKSIDKKAIFDAIRLNTDNMLDSPANLLGIKGIRKFAYETKKWLKFDDDKKRLTGITNYFMISADGGTGGGIFRKMYGEFLQESSEVTKNKELFAIGTEFLKISEMWNNIANLLMELYETGKDSIIQNLSTYIIEIADKEEAEFKQLRIITNS
ncbi:BtrH N-terminal domain-containing protein [Cloacibacterium sp.]|uniref:BtrH N-terminal domain-containing protein n=1 Tax=Cloacibacterium sp. TaxID=1913682 RepID=UPI0039E5FE98